VRFVSWEASDKNGQNDGGLVWLQGIRKFCRSVEARSVRSRAKDSSPGSVRFAGVKAMSAKKHSG